ncbi:c-type cytochrome [Flavobacterium difficile]|nr:cytochrome c [Flavobacterium difficile]
MKTKFILGLCALAFAYGCTAKKAVNEEVPLVVDKNSPSMMQSAKGDAPVVAVPLEVPEEKAEVTAEVLAEGKNLYGTNCAKCHKLYDAKSFTAEEWTPIVMRMQKKARISDEQREKIYAYLTTTQM